MEVVAPRGGLITHEFPRGLCWGCDYSLQGLSEPRCPECGRPFDPNVLSSMNFGPAGPMARWARRAKRILRPILLLGVCLSISWAMMFVILAELPPLLFLPGIYLAARRRWRLLAGFALLNPFSMLFFLYAQQYATGSALYVNGKTPVLHPATSIDPKTRIRGPIQWCGFSAPSLVSSLAQDSAGIVMYHLMGPPPGAYTGPYPTEEEAQQALAEDGTPIPMEAGMIDTIQTPAWKVVLPAPLRCRYSEHPGSVDRHKLVPTMAVWKQRCLIIKAPRDMDPKPYGPYEDIYLIDIQTSQMFGMYSRPK